MKNLETVIQLLSQLRDREHGCHWCCEQDFVSLNRYIFEEAHELRLAVQSKDAEKIKDELADVLLQPLFYAQIAQEQGLFDFNDVIETLLKKIQRRTQTDESWKTQKRAEKSHQSLLDHIEPELPATIRSYKIQAAAADVKFDWENIEQVLGVLTEEVDELHEAVRDNHSLSEQQAELGDILFTCVNIARHLHTDADYALSLSNEKFIRRFQYIEKRLQELQITFEDLDFNAMLKYWKEAKTHE